MIKQGFGSITDELINFYVLGSPSPTNADLDRNIIMQLPNKNEKRIFNIDVSYSVISPLPAETSLNPIPGLVGGRLIIVGQKYDFAKEEIKVDRKTLPESLKGATVFFDAYIGNLGANEDAWTPGDGIQNISRRFQFVQGLRIPSGSDASIILTYCQQNYNQADTTQYATDSKHLAILNVDGILDGSDKVYKDVR